VTTSSSFRGTISNILANRQASPSAMATYNSWASDTDTWRTLAPPVRLQDWEGKQYLALSINGALVPQTSFQMAGAKESPARRADRPSLPWQRGWTRGNFVRHCATAQRAVNDMVPAHLSGRKAPRWVGRGELKIAPPSHLRRSRPGPAPSGCSGPCRPGAGLLPG
jgi:hypothetical protein